MRKLLISGMCVLLGMVISFAASKPATLKSPDGRVVLTYSNFSYSVTVDGSQMLAPSAIGITLDNGTVYGGKAKLQKVSRKSVDRTISAINYKKASIRDHYNQMMLSYKDFNIEFRAYNEGVAYRFISKSKSRFDVRSEKADFSFPDDSKVYAAYSRSNDPDLQKQTLISFESYYTTTTVTQFEPNRLAFLPVVAEAPNGYKIGITEANLFSYPGLFVYNPDGGKTLAGYHANCPDIVTQGGHNNLQGVILSRKDIIAERCRPGFVFPWRIIQVAREDAELASSDMVYKLADDPEDKDWSWVKPGKVAWDWWNDWNIGGVDFKAGVNTKTYKYYIDFASEHGIEYVILDEGWAVNKMADLMQIVPEINLEEIIAYAKSRNVGIILWAGYWAVNRNIEEVFLHYSLMGVKGFKIDFMDRDDQSMVDFYTECARMGAKHKMVVDFHGAYKPTGLQRTYPNVLNFEGVNGLEQLKWSKELEQVNYDVMIPFIRMMAGPMDYTQGAMRNATMADYRPVNSEPMSQGTRCRQLAEYVVFDAPLTMMCDSPTSYMAEPECTEFISRIPTVWDETVVMGGKIGEFVSMARLSGEDWYVGAMTNWDERDMVISFSFLPAGNYQVEIFRDGVNADRLAKDYVKEVKDVTASTNLKVHLAPGGGWAARIIRN